MSKFKSSGYLKTLLIALVIIAAGIGGVVGLKVYDGLNAPVQPAQETEGPAVQGGETEGTVQGADGVNLTPAEGGPAGAGEDSRSAFRTEGEGSGGMAVIRNEDGSFTVMPAGEGDEPIEFEGGASVSSTFAPAEGVVLTRDPEAAKESIERAVTEGRMTREEADAMLERMESGEGRAPGMIRPADGETRRTGQGENVPADTPEADIPEADIPEADTPEADIPEVDTPEVDTPEKEGE